MLAATRGKDAPAAAPAAVPVVPSAPLLSPGTEAEEAETEEEGLEAELEGGGRGPALIILALACSSTPCENVGGPGEVLGGL